MGGLRTLIRHFKNTGHVFGALAGHWIQNTRLSEAAAEKNVASEAHNTPAPGVHEASQKRLVFKYL